MKLSPCLIALAATCAVAGCGGGETKGDTSTPLAVSVGDRAGALNGDVIVLGADAFGPITELTRNISGSRFKRGGFGGGIDAMGATSDETFALAYLTDSFTRDQGAFIGRNNMPDLPEDGTARLTGSYAGYIYSENSGYIQPMTGSAAALLDFAASRISVEIAGRSNLGGGVTGQNMNFDAIPWDASARFEGIGRGGTIDRGATGIIPTPFSPRITGMIGGSDGREVIAGIEFEQTDFSVVSPGLTDSFREVGAILVD